MSSFIGDIFEVHESKSHNYNLQLNYAKIFNDGNNETPHSIFTMVKKVIN